MVRLQVSFTGTLDEKRSTKKVGVDILEKIVPCTIILENKQTLLNSGFFEKTYEAENIDDLFVVPKKYDI